MAIPIKILHCQRLESQQLDLSKLKGFSNMKLDGDASFLWHPNTKIST